MFRVVRAVAVMLACAVAAVGISACGGDDEQTASVSLTQKSRDLENGSAASPSTGTPAPAGDAEQPAPDAEPTADPGAAADDAGKQIFVQSCGSCHTLADADASGQVGPNLDESTLDDAAIVTQVENGGGGMPSFKGTLQPDQIQAVAAYVTAANGP